MMQQEQKKKEKVIVTVQGRRQQHRDEPELDIIEHHSSQVTSHNVSVIESEHIVEEEVAQPIRVIPERVTERIPERVIPEPRPRHLPQPVSQQTVIRKPALIK